MHQEKNAELLYTAAYLISRLPMRVLYILSDGLYVIMYHMVRYRRGIVKKNLQSSFPEKTDSERKDIEKRFYHWFCDYFFETLKLLTATEDEVRSLIDLHDFDKITDVLEEGRSVAVMLGHYCNWEMLSCAQIFRNDEPHAVLGLIYHPLYNKSADRLFLRLREKHGGTCVAKQNILRNLVTLKKEGTPSYFGYILDQSPKWQNIHLWLDFMNQDTPVFTGAERIARKMQNVVVYADMSRPKRGHYSCTFTVITDKPQEMEEYELTRKTFRLLEQTIRRQPEYYLWTHNRWKRQRKDAPENIKTETH